MTAFRILLVPGGGGSGPDHWDHRWEAEDTRVERVIQADWNSGTRDDWVAALDRHVRVSDNPIVLVAHSLGCIVVAHWAAAHANAIVKGALLVAPTDVEADWAYGGSLYAKFRPIPRNVLPFPTTLVASTNDPYLSLGRAREFSDACGSRLEVAGQLGHIGSDSKLGAWDEGRKLLRALTSGV